MSKIILKTTVKASKEVQDFDPQSLAMGVEHSQMMKATPIASDCGSKDCASSPDSTAAFRIIDGKIEALAFGGKGILKKEGLVVFVPFTAIGDRILAKITKVHKNYADATLKNILSPSKSRISPRCPHFGICPGCQLQHLDSDAQNDYKQSIVTDAIERIGKATLKDLHFYEALKRWEYRRHIKLSLFIENNMEGVAKPMLLLGKERGKDFAAREESIAEAIDDERDVKDLPRYEARKSISFATPSMARLGYIGEDNLSLLEIQCCPIFVSEQNRVFDAIRELVKSLDTSVSLKGSLTLFKGNSGFILYFKFEKKGPKNLLSLLKMRYKDWQGVLVKEGKKLTSFGDTALTFSYEDLLITSTPDAFVQVHEEQSAKLYKQLSKAILNSKRVLDLYSGIGIVSLILAKAGMHTLGIEKNKQAVLLANHNKKQNHIENAEFLQASVEDVLEKKLKEFKADTVIINPPRSGLDPKVILALGTALPKEIFYISCMPSTLARDINLLKKYSYTIEEAKVFDMFPQTAHVETLLKLTRN